MYATDLVLLSRHILHRDAHWHVDRVQIADLHTLASPDARMFNPTLVTADVRLVVSRLKLRDPVFDGFSEFHEFAAPAHLLVDPTRLDDPAYADAIVFAYAASLFIRGQAHKLYKAKQAKQKRILMRRGAREWTVKLSSDAPHFQCSFLSAMDKPVHQKASWRFCRDTKAEAPPWRTSTTCRCSPQTTQTCRARTRAAATPSPWATSRSSTQSRTSSLCGAAPTAPR